MPKPPEPDFEKIAARVYDTLGEIGYTDPSEWEGEERRKQWVLAVASALRAEMGYDQAAD